MASMRSAAAASAAAGALSAAAAAPLISPRTPVRGESLHDSIVLRAPASTARNTSSGASSPPRGVKIRLTIPPRPRAVPGVGCKQRRDERRLLRIFQPEIGRKTLRPGLTGEVCRA